MQVPPYDPNFVYDPNDPVNVAARAYDPDDGIDYEQIIIETEADFRAGRGLRFKTIQELCDWLDKIEREVEHREREQERAAS